MTPFTTYHTFSKTKTHAAHQPHSRRRFNFAKSALPTTKLLTDQQYQHIVRGGASTNQTPDTRRYMKRRRDNHECTNQHLQELGGVYFISNNQIMPHESTKTLNSSPQHVRREVKIGLAGANETIHRRLNGYLLYWPMGVVVYGFLLVKPNNKMFDLYKTIRKYFPKTSRAKIPSVLIKCLEVYTHNVFKHENKRYRAGYDAETEKKHGHLSEWFVLKPTEIKSFLSGFHANVCNTIDRMSHCYETISNYLYLLQDLYQSHPRVMRTCLTITQPPNSWCHFKTSAVRLRVARARNQRQIPIKGRCSDAANKIQENKQYLSEIPRRHFQPPPESPPGSPVRHLFTSPTR